jgi:hypothetical protein
VNEDVHGGIITISENERKSVCQEVEIGQLPQEERIEVHETIFLHEMNNGPRFCHYAFARLSQ